MMRVKIGYGDDVGDDMLVIYFDDVNYDFWLDDDNYVCIMFCIDNVLLIH